MFTNRKESFGDVDGKLTLTKRPRQADMPVLFSEAKRKPFTFCGDHTRLAVQNLLDAGNTHYS